MGILKQNDDILKDFSGEPIKQPLTIDISSDYGVTKDGSNLVSSVRNRYQPNKFIAPSGNEPVENGNGFEFNSSNPYFNSPPFQYKNGFMFECWIKHVDYDSYQMIWVQNDRLTETNFTGLQIYHVGTSTHSLACSIYENGSNIILHTRTNAPYTGTENEYRHVLVAFDGSELTTFSDGIVLRHTSLNPSMINENSYLRPCVVGKASTVSYQYLRGSLYNIKVREGDITNDSKYIAWDTTTNSLKYTSGQLVFIPPTFPNTIL